MGYGHDEALGLDYWRAQNSWGQSWGEKGFIRLVRTRDNSTGQCGLATSPVVAEGGFLLPQGESVNGSASAGHSTAYRLGFAASD